MSEPSPYARLVAKRDPDLIARELDRLQAKLACYRNGLDRIAALQPSAFARIARETLQEGERITMKALGG